MSNIEIDQGFLLPTVVNTPNPRDHSISFGVRREELKRVATEAAVVGGFAIAAPVIIVGLLAGSGAEAIKSMTESVTPVRIKGFGN